jgi:hypothetical protein
MLLWRTDIKFDLHRPALPAAMNNGYCHPRRAWRTTLVLEARQPIIGISESGRKRLRSSGRAEPASCR